MGDAYSGDIGGFGGGGGTGYYNPTTGGHNTGGGGSSPAPATSVSITSLFGGGGSGWSTLFNLIGAGASAYGAYKSYEQGKDLAEAFTTSSRRISQLQEKSQAEQAARAAGERRQQIREERVKRSRIMQSSQNTGTGGSSGEAGALSSLSTQFGSNIGFNLGAKQTADSITGLNQEIADVSGDYQQQASEPNNYGLVSQVGSSIFAASGGFNTLKNIFK